MVMDQINEKDDVDYPRVGAVDCECVCHRIRGFWHNEKCDCPYNPPKKS